MIELELSDLLATIVDLRKKNAETRTHISQSTRDIEYMNRVLDRIEASYKTQPSAKTTQPATPVSPANNRPLSNANPGNRTSAQTRPQLAGTNFEMRPMNASDAARISANAAKNVHYTSHDKSSKAVIGMKNYVPDPDRCFNK